MNHYTIPIFIPELACPHRCIFCNQQKISGTLSIPSKTTITTIIETHLSTIDWKNNIVQIGFFGGNFTGIPAKDQETFLQLAHPYIRSGQVQGIRISSRPDYINEKSLRLLKPYHVNTIELGAQSFDDDVLMASGRGHTVTDTIKAARLIKQSGFDLGLQMMIGLPKDTQEKALHTANQIVALSASNTRIYPALVIKDTKLHDLYKQKKYTPLSLDETINWCKKLIPIFEKNNVKIIRMGLHPSKELSFNHDLIAGPFHRSFTQLVLSEMWWDILIKQAAIKKQLAQKIKSDKPLHIYTNSKGINYAAGYNATNKKRLLNFFKHVSFHSDDSLKGVKTVI